MNSDANIAARLSVGLKVNGQQNFTGFVEFFLPVSLYHGRHASNQYCRKVRLKYLIP